MVAVMSVGALMDLLDVTVVNVALPTLQRDFGATPSQLQWIVAGYLLVFGSTLVLWGRIGDALGRRRVFLGSVAAFGLASLLAGLAPTLPWLLAARFLQGGAAAALVPQVLATFRSALDPDRRRGAFGVYGAVAGLSAALGVLLGGLLTTFNVLGLGWRAIFLVNVPVSLVVLVVGWRVVPETRTGHPGRVDVSAAIVLLAATAALLLGLTQGPQEDWPAWTIACVAAAPLGWALFVWRSATAEVRGVEALLPMVAFRSRAFGIGLAVQGLFSGALQGFSVALTLWLQLGRGLSPLQTGLVLIAFTAGSVLTAPRAGQLAARRGRIVLASGAALLALGTLTVGKTAWQQAGALELPSLLLGLALAGAGLGLLVVPLVDVVLTALPADLAGGASGTFSTAAQLGGAIGVAVIGNAYLVSAGAGTDHAFAAILPLVAGCYGLAGLLSLALPLHAATSAKYPA